MRRLTIALVGVVALAACERAPEGRPPTDVDIREAYDHLLAGQERPILRGREGRSGGSVRVELTVDETGRVTRAVASEAPAEVRKAAAVAALDLHYRPFLIGGRARPVAFETWETFYPPEILPTRHVAFPAGDLSTVRIRLARGGCYGRCPIYKIEIRGDGSVTYRGETFAAIVGEHHVRIPSAVVAALVEQFRAADFFSLQDKYQAPVTDSPTYVVTFERGGQSKTVTDYIGLGVGMPSAVTRVEQAIDRAAGTRRWVRGDDETMAALRAEHWDFTSEDAARSLIWNAGQGSEPLARALLDAGAPLDPVGDPLIGRSAMEAALVAGRLSLARTLIAHGALQRGGSDAAERALIAAARSGQADVVAEILTHHPDVNRVIDGQSALIAAVGVFWERRIGDRRSTTDATALLLNAGADPNLKGRESETALHLAMDAQTVRLLVKAGARLETRDQMGRTPLLATHDEDVAIALVDAGADVHAKDAFGSDIAEQARQYDWKKMKARLARR